MATKVYRMNLRRTYARVIVEGNGGEKAVFEFTNGNPVASVPARCILKNAYYQDILENSEIFNTGKISLESVTETADEKAQREAEAAAEAKRLASMVQVESVKNVTEAIAYVAENFNEKATTARAAKAIAEKNGVLFPNLKLGKN